MIALNKMQINPEFVNNSVGVAENLFRHENYFTLISNNKKELIRLRQQCRVLIALCRESVKLITSSRTDDSGLGHWNWIRTQNPDRKITIISAY